MANSFDLKRAEAGLAKNYIPIDPDRSIHQYDPKEDPAITESNRTGIRGKMNAAANVIRKVSDKFSNDPVYCTYLKFQMNDLVIESNSQDRNRNLLMSFTNKKNGSGYANSFNIRIAYAPDTGEQFNINYIDEAITRGERYGYEMSSRYCQLTYGYGDTDLRTVTYNGLVMDYTCEIQDGMLVYDISGYSSLVLWNEVKNPISWGVDSSQAIKPTTAFRTIVENYLQTGDDAVVKKPYAIKFDDNVEGSDAAVYLPAAVDKNVGKALDDILKKAVLEADYDKLQKGQISQSDTVYTWFVSDEVEDDSYQGTIWVVMFNKEQIKEQNDSAIVFNWMSPGAPGEANHIVLNFKPEFQGSVLLSKAAMLLNPKKVKTDENGKESTYQDATNEDLYDGSYFMNNKGALEKCANTNAAIPGGDREFVNVNVASHQSDYISELNYPYKASMVTMGIPCEIPITGTIKIIPMIYGQPHFSNGIYMVLGITDEINNGGGFTTSWELMRTDKAVETETPPTAPAKTAIVGTADYKQTVHENADKSTGMTETEKARHYTSADLYGGKE